MPCLKVINWFGRTDKKLSSCKRASPFNQSISHDINQMKHHSVKDVTVSLYPYSFDLHRRRNFMERSMCGSALVGTRTTGKRWRTIATCALWTSYRRPLRDTSPHGLSYSTTSQAWQKLGRYVEWRRWDFGRLILGIVSTSGLWDNL